MNSSGKPGRAAPNLADFPHRTTDNIRFADIDVQGHVNNTVIADYFQTGRVTMFHERDLSGGVEGTHVALVHTEITFVRELRWPGTVEIGTAVTKIGRSSYTVMHGVFSDGECAAHGTATLVLIDADSRRPTAIPEAFAERLKAWSYRGEAD